MTSSLSDQDQVAPRPSGFRRWLPWLLRLAGIALAIALLGITFRQTDADFFGSLRGASQLLLFYAFLCISQSHLLGAWRWGCLLQVQGIKLPFLQLYRLTLIGAFFSAVIPGTVSGDVVKMAYATKAAPEKSAAAALTVALDRVIGLAGLFVVAALASLALLARHPELPFQQPLIGFSILAIWAGTLAFALLYLVLLGRTWLLRRHLLQAITAWLASRLPGKLVSLFVKLVAAVDLYKSNQLVLLFTLLQSIVVHFFLGLGVFWLGRGFQEHAVTLLQYLLTAQIGNATGVLPFTPGGIGLREAVTAALFSAFNAQPPTIVATIPIANTLLTTVWTLTGAVIWLCQGKKSTHAPSP